MPARHGLEIRAATSVDAPAVAELLAAVGRPLDARLVAERPDGLRADPGVVLLTSAWGPPAGLIALSWRRSLLAAPVAVVTTLLVAPDERRHGIARLLLKAGAQAARQAGCGELHLPVPPDAPELLAYGQATGFADTGVLLTRPLRKGG